MFWHKVYRRVQRRLFPTERQKTVRRWCADDGDRKLRLNYYLDESSLVLDLGGYQGQWASDIFSMYCCRVVVFEPVKEFAEAIQKRFARNPRIEVLPFGLGARTRPERISLCKDGSSIYKVSPTSQEIQIRDIAEWLHEQEITAIDLMKINIEGGEYEVLDRLIETGLIRTIRNVQVQFHDIATDSNARMEQIQEQLSHTHAPTYQYRFVWENWALK
jgi:FkbM family methyltransferase